MLTASQKPHAFDPASLAQARSCLIGASDRLATFRRIGDLNRIDRELHANAVQDLYYALDLVWAAQLARVSA